MSMHRATANTMTEAQAAQLCVSYGASFVSTRQGIDWWKLPDGTFLGVKKLGDGLAQVNRVAASACGCG